MPVSKRHHHELSWPKLRGGMHQVACHFCDTLQEAPRLREGDGAFCIRCGKMLYRNQPRSLAHATAFSFASLVLMVITHTFPFLTLTSGGQMTTLTLWEASRVLAAEDKPVLAVAVMFFTTIAPLILMGGMFYVAAPLRYGHAWPGAVTITRCYQRMEPWSMMEVFSLGLVVSVLKLREMADAHYEIGLWALGALVLCMAAAMGGIDRMELWDRLEIVEHHPEEAH